MSVTEEQQRKNEGEEKQRNDGRNNRKRIICLF